MRPIQLLRAVLLLAIVFTVGCTSNNKDKIEGTKWSSEGTSIKGKEIPSGALQLDFASDGRLTYQVGFESHTGTYSLGMGNSVTFNFDQELAGRKNHVEKIVIEGDKLVMTDSDGTQVSFRKSGGGAVNKNLDK